MNISMYVFMHLCVLKSLRMMDGYVNSVLFSSLPLVVLHKHITHNRPCQICQLKQKTIGTIILKWIFKWRRWFTQNVLFYESLFESSKLMCSATYQLKRFFGRFFLMQRCHIDMFPLRQCLAHHCLKTWLSTSVGESHF